MQWGSHRQQRFDSITLVMILEESHQGNGNENLTSVKRLFQHLKKGESQYEALLHEALLRGREGEGTAQDSFAQGLIDDLHAQNSSKLPEYEILLKKLKGSILVDLGGGRLSRMLPIAETFGASGYVNVDRHITGNFGSVMYDPALNQYEKFWDERRAMSGWEGLEFTTSIEPAIVYADMLDFVARLPDNCVNFTANGIDKDILGYGPEHTDYKAALAREIVRAMKPDGIIFGRNLQAIADTFTDKNPRGDTSPAFQELGLRRLHLPDESHNSTVIFEKIRKNVEIQVDSDSKESRSGTVPPMIYGEVMLKK